MLIPTRMNSLVKGVDGVTQQVWSARSAYGANEVLVSWLVDNDPFCRNGHPIASVQEDNGVRTFTYSRR